MKPEVRTYKTMMKVYVPAFPVDESERVSMFFDVHEDWYYKNGKAKKKDVHNLSKVLVDLVCEKMGFDDALVWNFSLNKVQSESAFVNVSVRKFHALVAKNPKR